MTDGEIASLSGAGDPFKRILVEAVAAGSAVEVFGDILFVRQNWFLGHPFFDPSQSLLYDLIKLILSSAWGAFVDPCNSRSVKLFDGHISSAEGTDRSPTVVAGGSGVGCVSAKNEVAVSVTVGAPSVCHPCPSLVVRNIFPPKTKAVSSWPT